MQASRPSRATWTYFTSSWIGRPSAGRCALRKRRWSWASIRATTASTGSGKRRSIHGEICMTGRGSGVWKTSRSDDPLHPGRAALRVGRDHESVGAGPVVIPAPAVDDPGAVDALGGPDQHGDGIPRTSGSGERADAARTLVTEAHPARVPVRKPRPSPSGGKADGRREGLSPATRPGAARPGMPRTAPCPGTPLGVAGRPGTSGTPPSGARPPRGPRPAARVRPGSPPGGHGRRRTPGSPGPPARRTPPPPRGGR